MQTKKQSWAEAITNVLVGYWVNIFANFAIFPIFGWALSLRDNMTIGVFYTVVSLLRSYTLRRFYNMIHK
jgi:hypothetical protein